ncbi:MAG TPA: tail fiber protein [Flavisolibacter sp.]|nr:tail fiber protein [Flavisolibacter sp.]
MSFNFPPKGWAFSNGQLLPINQNQALYSLLGTVFGGNGQTNFALPNLQGRTPIHVGGGHSLGQQGGEQAHTLSIAEIPAHTHLLSCTNTTGNTIVPSSTAVLASATPSQVFSGPQNTGAMHASTVTSTGGGQAHLNMQPYLVLTFCIALQGVFPSRD